MNQVINVVIVMSRCCRSKELFGIRFEEKRAGQWFADWAFSVMESTSKKEGYDNNQIKGDVFIDDEYPGCPNPGCKNPSFVLCSQCQKVYCYDGTSSRVTCPWCGAKRSVGGNITALNAAGDR